MNFGWSCMEGRHLYSGNCPEPPNHVPPVWEYSHGSGCSITGGYVVRDPALPSLVRSLRLHGLLCVGLELSGSAP